MHEKAPVSQINLFGERQIKESSSKRCPKCRLEKSTMEFPVRSLQVPRPCSYCRPCQREISKEHYRTHAVTYKLKRRASQQRVIERNLSKIEAIFDSRHCVDCGEGDSTVLEFDHVRGLKLGNVSKMAYQGLSWKRVFAEILKCEVRCANCHRRKTLRVLREHKGLADGR